MTYYSPLRYPGGKRRLAKFVALLCEKNEIDGHYVEPYAGGAAVALHVLLNDYVKEITINDIDRSIYAFWYSVRNKSEEFCRLIEKTDITVENWLKQKEVQLQKKRATLLELGFSTFFLNRTNISGIIGAGPMGGMQQTGKYKMDCRFNKSELIKRIQKIAEKRERIHVTNKDAMLLVSGFRKRGFGSSTIFYFDPPYYMKGESLYMNAYDPDDHKEVSREIGKIKGAKWIVSYDAVREVESLYSGYKKIKYSLAHSAREARIGKEILFFSHGLKVPKAPNPARV